MNKGEVLDLKLSKKINQQNQHTATRTHEEMNKQNKRKKKK